jgi:hypothetical protein
MQPRAAFLQSRALRGGNDEKWRLACAGGGTAVTASSEVKAAWFVMAIPKHRGETEERPEESNKMRGGRCAMAMVWGVWRKERKVV